ncbi:hypothetical protein TNCV_3582351 [Trichonephila clavipes]|nr:hypothetical protein TNCV_3582351 [Trichonephila clavipes]
MWIEALYTVHIEQKNDLEISLFLPLRESKHKAICTGDALFVVPEKTFIAPNGCVGPGMYHCAFKQMVLLALKSSTVNSSSSF